MTTPLPDGNTEEKEPTVPPPKRPLSKRMRRWVLEALVLALVYWSVTQFQTRGLLAVGEPAPSLDLRDVDGRQASLKDFKGKTVLLHFWATWCGVCVQEFPMLRDFQAALPKNTVLLSVVEDGDNENLQAFLLKNQLNYPVLLGTSEVIRRFKVNAYPTNYFIDANGIVRGRSIGLSTQWGLKSRVGCAR